jgi:hypothetical protein
VISGATFQVRQYALVAVCATCKREMRAAPSCDPWSYHVDGVSQPMIPYGAETRYGPDYRADKPCHDCRVQPGGWHHPGCDWAQCPCCGGQLLGCECVFDEEAIGPEPL